MKHGTEEKQVVRQGNDECDHAKYHRVDGFGKMNSEREQNWAWTTSGSQYDWMDSHAPFADLD